MAICSDGIDTKLSSACISISIQDNHPLIALANSIPWNQLSDPVIADLKKTTTKGCWWLGRKIHVRIHLAIYLLQKIYDLTDRQAEYWTRDNAAFQLFCGRQTIENWHAPDHTKIEEFRNRLSPETQRYLANTLAESAVQFGFADPSILDIDSTVQEANISYPSDANLMTKLAGIATKVISYLKKKTKGFIPDGLNIDLKAIRTKAREYWFAPKNMDRESKNAIFQELHHLVKQELRPIVDLCESLDPSRLKRMPWNIRRAVGQINTYAWRYLLDVAHFVRKGQIKAGKVLSFHAQEIACISKGKAHKAHEFGRVIQLGRIKGNFLFVLECIDIHMSDKTSFPMFIEEHAKIFGQNKITSIATDKGYYSSKNKKAAKAAKIEEIGIQQPANLKVKVSGDQMLLQESLKDRRAGIEPLIGHAKHGGQLGKSRMKSDAATKAAAYGSVLGLNLRQMIRYQTGKVKTKAA